MSFKSEFKDFVSNGNVLDLAIGVVIGAAFGKIVSSLVEDVLMPPIGILIGGVNFSELKIILQQAGIDAAGKAVEAVTINYGNFIQNIINFLIISLAIFVFVVKPMNRIKKKPVPVVVDPPALSTDQLLLAEIRDLLKGPSTKAGT